MPNNVIDLSQKLGLNGKPKIIIGEKELVVDNSAIAMLRLMELIGDDGAELEMSPKAVFEASRLLFEKESVKVLEKMELSFEDYTTVIEAAMELITGGEVEGEAETLDTTS